MVGPTLTFCVALGKLYNLSSLSSLPRNGACTFQGYGKKLEIMYIKWLMWFPAYIINSD